jgi:predicted Zn-dependent protease
MGNTPFSEFDGAAAKNKIGQRVIDRRLRLVSDPSDALGGFPPFYEQGGNGPPGLPIPAVTWIDEGILKTLAYTLTDGWGRPWSEYPYSVRLESMPGISTATVDEMIAACDDGVLITRFDNVSIVDNRAGTLSGVTRDGCFHIRHGAIDRPVKNFRFLESPLHAFNRVHMIGVAMRAALGQEAPTQADFYGTFSSRGRWSRWPRSPVMAPALMIEDFSLTALADAV